MAELRHTEAAPKVVGSEAREAAAASLFMDGHGDAVSRGVVHGPSGKDKADAIHGQRGQNVHGIRFGDMAVGAAVDELDDTEEFAGVGDAYDSGRAIRRFGVRAKGADADGKGGRFGAKRPSGEGESSPVGGKQNSRPGTSKRGGKGGVTFSGGKASPGGKATRIGGMPPSAPAYGKAVVGGGVSSESGKAALIHRRAAESGSRLTGTAKAGKAGSGSLATRQAGRNWTASRAAVTGTVEQAGLSAAPVAAAAEGSSTGALVAGGGSIASVVGGVVAGILAFVLAVMLVGQLAGALFGFWENEASKKSIEGLPPYITYEMVLEALECQEEYGHPAGCTLAQIIVESGMGDTMSQLATRDHNLFGMKWSSSFAAASEVAGKAAWVTSEEYEAGTYTTITDYFTVFNSDTDCIRFRSRVFLQGSRYAGNALIQEAIANHDSDKMAEGLKDAGWATSSTYVDSLKSVMDTYNLRRFDGLSVADFEAAGADGSAIVAAAYSQLGVPYVWGGSTPGVALDCSGLTQYCYAQAGISISHYTESQKDELTMFPLSQAQPGDILYRPGHVAIYIGGDNYIHAPQTGDVVRVANGITYFSCALRKT